MLDLRNPALVGAPRQLCRLLVLLLEGKAFCVLRPIPKGEGLMVWRKLVREFEPDQPASALGRMRKLMGWTFGAATIETGMNEFDVAGARAVRQRGSERHQGSDPLCRDPGQGPPAVADCQRR